MQTHHPLHSLDVVGIPFLNATPSPGLTTVLNAYDQSTAYQAAGVPVAFKLPDFSPQAKGAVSDSADPVEVETDEIGRLNGKIADLAAHTAEKGHALLMTGGNCCHITGIIGGLQDAYGPQLRVGLVWFDAHGDFNTPHTSLSGMLGGMPVAVCAGLAFPRWREYSHIVAPLPTDRILMVDVRNLDQPEEELIRSTDIVISPVGPSLKAAVDDLAARCDLLYLHIDSDILDAKYVPNHKTQEPDGPDMDQVLAAADTVLATGKVGAVALVSIFGEGEGTDTAIASGVELLEGTLSRWAQHGMARGK